MKRYTYVHLKVSTLKGASYEDHREIINNYADMGFRYVGYIPAMDASWRWTSSSRKKQTTSDQIYCPLMYN